MSIAAPPAADTWPASGTRFEDDPRAGRDRGSGALPPRPPTAVRPKSKSVTFDAAPNRGIVPVGSSGAVSRNLQRQ